MRYFGDFQTLCNSLLFVLRYILCMQRVPNIFPLHETENMENFLQRISQVESSKKKFDVCSYFFSATPHCLKITQNVAFWHFPPNFCPIKTDLSGNSV